MLQPKRVKYRKTHKGRRRGSAQSGNITLFGDYGLQALEPAWVTGEQIEAARRAITRHLRRGKGAPDHWVAVVRPGRVMFELAGVGESTAKEAIRLASHKLPLSTRFIVREAVGH
jgi:large subunit ribosomal protein L16